MFLIAYFRKRGKKWYYTIEIRDELGNRKKVERVGGLTKAACEKAYRAVMVDVDYTGEYRSPADLTVKDFFLQWEAEYVEARLKQNTIRSYRNIIENHIIPTLGEMKLRRVTGRILQNFLNEKVGSYSRGTVGSICSVLKKAFSYAAATSRAAGMPVFLSHLTSSCLPRSVAALSTPSMSIFFAVFRSTMVISSIFLKITL